MTSNIGKKLFLHNDSKIECIYCSELKVYIGWNDWLSTGATCGVENANLPEHLNLSPVLVEYVLLDL